MGIVFLSLSRALVRSGACVDEGVTEAVSLTVRRILVLVDETEGG